MKKQIISPRDAPQAIGPYSVGVKVDNLVFTAGQLGLDPQTGKFVEGGVEEQTRQALKNLEAIMREAGTDLNSVVKTTVFLKDMEDFAAMNAVYGEFFTADFPARSAVQAARLPLDGLVEIEAVAVIK